MDSSGVDGTVSPQGKGTSTFIRGPTRGEDTPSGNDSPNAQPGPSQGHTLVPRQLSASRHTLLRKYLTEKDMINLPRGRPTMALTKGQMHTKLKTISDENILSTFHLMKSLLLQVTLGKILSKEQCRHLGRATSTANQYSNSSGDETTDVDPPVMGILVEPTTWTMSRTVCLFV